ncbi:MAG: POTRA domain-containing protein [bacterium]
MKNKIIFLIFFLFLLINKQIIANDFIIKEIRIKGNYYTQEKVILHFLDFKIGDKLSKQELEQKIKKTQQKLFSTFYFFDVNVFLLPSSELNKAVILIEVEEGFLWRFGGGPIYASIGLDNLCGQAKNIDCKLGLNIQSIHYKDLKLFDTRFIIDIFGSHTIGEEYEVENTEKKFEIEQYTKKITLGYNYKLLLLCQYVNFLLRENVNFLD